MIVSDPRSDDPVIRLVEDGDEVTLCIDSGQAMQAWERELMWESADILCRYGSCFLEVGLGLGLSALRIASHPNTRRHVVVEKYPRVIELFRERHPALPPGLEIVQADFFDHVRTLAPESLDGVFFDPYLPLDVANDPAVWNDVMPLTVRALRRGGVFIPCFSSRPILRWQFVPFFDRVIVERRSFRAYPSTEYMAATAGDAFIQCYEKT